MRPILLLLSYVVLNLYACTDSVCEPNTLRTTFSEQASINMYYDTSREQIIYDILEGENLVFQHVYHHGHCEGNGDDDFTTTVGFELPRDSTKFILQDSALADIDCYVYQLSTWIQDYYPIYLGKVDAEKISDDEWLIKGSVAYWVPAIVPRLRTIKFNSIFKR